MIEFVDTNILIYANDRGSGRKREIAVGLLDRLFRERAGALSVQILIEFYDVMTRRFHFSPEQATAPIVDLGCWKIHCPGHADVLNASRLHRQYRLQWWDALVINSANELGCATLWSEDFSHGQQYGSVTARNPFAEAASA
jgi:predicted nucleic acid-binding protein